MWQTLLYPCCNEVPDGICNRWYCKMAFWQFRVTVLLVWCANSYTVYLTMLPVTWRSYFKLSMSWQNGAVHGFRFDSCTMLFQIVWLPVWLLVICVTLCLVLPPIIFIANDVYECQCTLAPRMQKLKHCLHVWLNQAHFTKLDCLINKWCRALWPYVSWTSFL